MTELPWMAEAKKHIGLKEIVGAKHNPKIVEWLKEIGNFPGAAKSWYFEDETPWCGLFVGYCLGKSGRAVIKDWYRAKAWANAGLTKLDKPAYGCIAVKSRKGGGHVFFVVGKDKQGRILGLRQHAAHQSGRRNLPATAATAAAPDGAASAEGWELLGKCAAEYAGLAETADDQAADLREWQAYGGAVSQ